MQRMQRHFATTHHRNTALQDWSHRKRAQLLMNGYLNTSVHRGMQALAGSSASRDTVSLHGRRADLVDGDGLRRLLSRHRPHEAPHAIVEQHGVVDDPRGGGAGRAAVRRRDLPAVVIQRRGLGQR